MTVRYWAILLTLVLTSCSLGTGGDPSEHEWCTVTPAGGTYEFSNGMTLIVPPGAVSEDTPLYVEDMSQSDLEAFLAVRGLQAEDLAFAFHVGPGTFAFSEAVTVRIPVNTLAAGDLPFVQVHDLDNGSFGTAEVSYLFDSVENVIELTTDHFSG